MATTSFCKRPRPEADALLAADARPVLAESRVEEPRVGGARVRVFLVDGERGPEVLCPDLAGYERERERLLARMRSSKRHAGKGAPELGALVGGLSDIFHPYFGIERGAFDGAFFDLYVRYETHGVFERAWRLLRTRKADPREALLDSALEETSFYLFEEPDDLPRMVYRFDQPFDAVAGALVGSGRDDSYWEVPVAEGWKEQVHDQELAVVDGKLVVGRDPLDPRVLYAIARRDGAYRVCAFHYDAKLRRLRVVPEPLLHNGRPVPGVVPIHTRTEEARLRAKARRAAGKRKPRRQSEEIPFVLCQAKGHDADLDGVDGTLTVDLVDEEPILAVFDPDDESIPNAEFEVRRWSEDDDAIRISDEDGDSWVFQFRDPFGEDDGEIDEEHPFNERLVH